MSERYVMDGEFELGKELMTLFFWKMGARVLKPWQGRRAHDSRTIWQRFKND